MDKFKFLIVLIILFIFAEGAGLIYFAQRSQKLKKAETKVVEVEKQDTELMAKYEELESKFRAIERDRNNLLAQTKRLMAEKADSEDAGSGAAMEKLEAMKKLYDAEKAELEKKNRELESALAGLKEAQASAPRIVEEEGAWGGGRESAKDDRSKSVIRDLKDEIASLKREKKGIEKSHKRDLTGMQKEIKRAERELDRAEK
jgi:chromosome segregation ATPase